MERYALGVDLGTTYAAAAVWRAGQVEMAGLGRRSVALPSVVYLRADGTLLVGDDAVRRGADDPERLAREFKRRMGDPTPLLLGGSPHSAASLSAALLSEIIAVVCEREGGAPAAVTVTHPANWGPYKQELLTQTLQMAEVTDARTLTEPEAAAVSYAANTRVEPGARIGVYDLGGGTFDAAVLAKTDESFTIVGEPVGIERLGGIDFDAAVRGHVMRALPEVFAELDEHDPATRAALARLRADCTEAKEALSSDTETVIAVAFPSVHTSVRLTRSEFEELIRPTLTPTVTALERAVRSAELTGEDLAAVLLVGGSSRIPLVSELLSHAFGRPIALDAHPKHAVALGAARHAAATLADDVPGSATASVPAPPTPASPAEPPPATPASPAGPPPATPPSLAEPPPATPPPSSPQPPPPARGSAHDRVRTSTTPAAASPRPQVTDRTRRSFWAVAAGLAALVVLGGLSAALLWLTRAETPPTDLSAVEPSDPSPGSTTQQTPTPPPPEEPQADPPDAARVSAGWYHHACQLDADGAPTCWGNDHAGQSSPPEGLILTSIGAGSDHTCGLDRDGAPVCWGADAEGRTSPPEGRTFTTMSVGEVHTCALDPDGAPVCWGPDSTGQSSPPEGLTLTHISAGRYHTCGLDPDGAPVCWGEDHSGQSSPPEGLTLTSISAGSLHTCGLTAAGEPLCWGADGSGESTPPAGLTLASVSAGYQLTCGLDDVDTPVCWGWDDDGQASPP